MQYWLHLTNNDVEVHFHEPQVALEGFTSDGNDNPFLIQMFTSTPVGAPAGLPHHAYTRSGDKQEDTRLSGGQTSAAPANGGPVSPRARAQSITWPLLRPRRSKR